jgi:hypothetical protein
MRLWTKLKDAGRGAVDFAIEGCGTRGSRLFFHVYARGVVLYLLGTSARSTQVACPLVGILEFKLETSLWLNQLGRPFFNLV